MNKSNKLLSDFVSFEKYARFLPHKSRRETLEEIINRNMAMHLEKYPKLSRDIIKAYKQTHDLKQMPSMRAMQFGGEPIVKNNVRQYNCSFLNVNYTRAFAETLYILLCGTGVGYSVQKHHTKNLPLLRKPVEEEIYVIHDSITGWAEALNQLMSAYFFGGIRPIFDYSKIRPKGSYLVTTGAKAPGPEPLKQMLNKVKLKLDEALYRQLTTLEVHDIMCIIADCVLAGGIRRAALMCLFSRDDKDLLTCKHGEWWNKHPYRARANNSAVLPRESVTKDEFKYIYDMCIDSNAGEPGFFWTNNIELGTNPCKPLNSYILTPNGYITFKEALEMDSLQVYNSKGKVVTATKPFITGKNKAVYKIKLSNGLFLYGTSNHKHQLANGDWKEIKDLKMGDRLSYKVSQKISLCVDNVKDYETGTLLGWLYGDGWNFERSDSPQSKRAGLCFGKNEMDVVSYFENILNKKHKNHDQKPETCKVIAVDQSSLKGYDKLDNLNWLRTESSDFKLGFIRAIFTSDGSVRRDNNVELYSINKSWLEQIILVLQEFGIRSTLTVHSNSKIYKASDNKIRNNKKAYKINVHSGQFKKIGFLSKTKQDLLNKQNDKGLFRRKDYETVVEISLHSVEDVYDITLYDETHAFIDTGVVTHNCGEISLHSNQFCNLTTTNLSGIKSEKDFMNRIYASSLIGTLQAGYTDFPYLNSNWQITTENEALLGCSFTGIADAKQLKATDLKKAAKLVLEVNEKYAKKIGINIAARTTAIKPEGTSSCVLGSSSGIHARHSEYYLRRIRLNKGSALEKYLSQIVPDLVEDDLFSQTGSVLTVPQKSPDGAILRTSESAVGLFNRIKLYYNNWILPGHRYGENTHNVSATISYKNCEINELFEKLWDDRNKYAAVSLLPVDDNVYQQAPFEECTKEEYDEMMKRVGDVDLTNVIEMEDKTTRNETVACGSGGCELV